MTDYKKIADQAAKVLVAANTQGWRNKPDRPDHDRIVGATQKIVEELGFRMTR